MAMMKEKLKERVKDGEQERVRREIKMAMHMKVKEQRAQQAMGLS